ncbi:MAG: hypothetical protein ACKOCX_07995, partial [Planctomycetota bacterium]
MTNAPDRLSLRLALPGLPELEPLVRDFAGHALRLADFTGARQADLLEAFVSGLGLIEDALRREGDAAVELELRADIDAEGLEFRVLEHGMPLGGTDATGAGQAGADI